MFLFEIYESGLFQIPLFQSIIVIYSEWNQTSFLRNHHQSIVLSSHMRLLFNLGLSKIINHECGYNVHFLYVLLLLSIVSLRVQVSTFGFARRGIQDSWPYFLGMVWSETSLLMLDLTHIVLSLSFLTLKVSSLSKFKHSAGIFQIELNLIVLIRAFFLWIRVSSSFKTLSLNTTQVQVSSIIWVQAWVWRRDFQVLAWIFRVFLAVPSSNLP